MALTGDAALDEHFYVQPGPPRSYAAALEVLVEARELHLSRSSMSKVARPLGDSSDRAYPRPGWRYTTGPMTNPRTVAG